MAPKRSRRRALIAAAIIVGTAPVWLFALFIFPGIYWWAADAAVTLFATEEVVEFEMRWSLDERQSASGDKRVRLRFVDYPGYAQLVADPELEAYLQDLDSQTVSAEYSTTAFLGRTMGFHLVRVGDLDLSPFSTTGWVAAEGLGASPFGKPFWWFL